MKKIYLAAITVLSAFPFISQAQWTSGGSGNYYLNSGYASIGTMNFLHPLTVSNGSSGAFSQTQIGLYNPYTSNADVRNWMIATDTYSYGSIGITTSISQGGNPSSSGITRLLIDKAGKIGIGTTSPQSNLHIVGIGTSVDAYDQFTGGGLIVQGNTNSRSSTIGAQLEFVIPANTDGSNLWGQARIITVAGNTGNGDATGKMILGTRRYYNKQNIAGQWYYGNDIVIDGAGKVGIGTTNPDQLLTVKGTIHSQEVKVDLSVPGPDYVFEPTYKLPSLAEVRAFIDKNHHLSEIPSADEMAKNGLDLGDINMKLLKKVEELTLYLIEKDKEVKGQQEEISKLKQQGAANQTQQKQIDKLRKQVETLLKKKS